jgi:hypothetical protein
VTLPLTLSATGTAGLAEPVGRPTQTIQATGYRDWQADPSYLPQATCRGGLPSRVDVYQWHGLDSNLNPMISSRVNESLATVTLLVRDTSGPPGQGRTPPGSYRDGPGPGPGRAGSHGTDS